MNPLIGAIILFVTCNALAAPDPCPAIEFAELQTYSDADLSQIVSDYSKRAFVAGAPNSHFQSCIDQIKRIARIQETRKKEKERQNN